MSDADDWGYEDEDAPLDLSVAVFALTTEHDAWGLEAPVYGEYRGEERWVIIDAAEDDPPFCTFDSRDVGEWFLKAAIAYGKESGADEDQILVPRSVLEDVLDWCRETGGPAYDESEAWCSAPARLAALVEPY